MTLVLIFQAGEYFHGTIELTEENTSIILLYGEDATRPLMDRVYNFAIQILKLNGALVCNYINLFF